MISDYSIKVTRLSNYLLKYTYITYILCRLHRRNGNGVQKTNKCLHKTTSLYFGDMLENRHNSGYLYFGFIYTICPVASIYFFNTKFRHLNCIGCRLLIFPNVLNCSLHNSRVTGVKL